MSKKQKQQEELSAEEMLLLMAGDASNLEGIEESE